MQFRLCTPLLAAALGAGMVAPAAAQQKPSIAIMPTQYFSADAESAKNVTAGLAQQFEGQGYKVQGADQSAQTFSSLNLDPSTHYADAVALKFGRSAGTDLVAYPRLLALGLPFATNTTADTSKMSDLIQPAAVVLVRVLNVHTGQAIYARQIAHEYLTDAGMRVAASDFHLPEPVAVATATDVTSNYFQRVAGSREEFRRAPSTGMPAGHRTMRHRRIRGHRVHRGR